MKAFLLCCLIFLSSCAPTNPGETNAQKYYAAKSHYYSLLTLAVDYKRQCDTRPVNHPCYAQVDRIRDHDSKLYLQMRAIESQQGDFSAYAIFSRMVDEFAILVLKEQTL